MTTPWASWVTNGILNWPADKASFTDLLDRGLRARGENCRKYEWFGTALSAPWGKHRRGQALAQLLVDTWYKGERRRLIAHSYGAVVAQLAATRYLPPSHELDEVHLFAAASDEDLERAGWNAALRRGQVKRLVFYCSRRDGALALAQRSWQNRVLRAGRIVLGSDYRWAGLEGPCNIAPDVADRVSVRSKNEYDHSAWVAADNLELTLDMIQGREARRG